MRMGRILGPARVHGRPRAMDGGVQVGWISLALIAQVQRVRQCRQVEGEVGIVGWGVLDRVAAQNDRGVQVGRLTGVLEAYP